MNQAHHNTPGTNHDPETAYLREALNRTYMERLLFATKLYKIQQTLKKATYTHKEYKAPARS